MGQRKAVTKAIATRYTRSDKAGKDVMLDELCAMTGCHRNHARRALVQALRPRIVRPRKPREPRYWAEVITALAFCWAVLGAPTRKRLAPIMGELVPRLRRLDELDVSEDTQAGPGPATPTTGRTWNRRTGPWCAPCRRLPPLRHASRTRAAAQTQADLRLRVWSLADSNR